ncbi:SpaA isopeptide-forming pilin-related protein [Weissella confusa]|uniref:SpaA isopeptide-forming pilin-related protein n=1 Tax=Weissella confusa TaxID=1583 RepID=UPI0022FEC030|nr:SpaA isopeptide-forming pilin-related protein [Weissella confusa]
MIHKKNGKVTFSNLEPNTTYGVLELVEPAGYTVNSTLKPITLSPADAEKGTSAATDADASDGFVYFQGGEYDFGNFTPKVDKSIQVTGQTGWTGQGVEGKEDNKIDADDDHQGVDRGEDFKWLIQSDLPADGTIFTTYKLTDTLPYQTNWYSALVDVAGVDLVNVQHINPQGKGGLTGNGITYDNQKDGNAMKITGIAGDGSISEEATGQTLKSGVEMTEVTGSYDNLVDKLGQETVDNLIGTTVTTDGQLADWLNDHLNVSGRSSYYKFDTDNRTVLADQKKDGELVIAPDDKAQALFSALAKVAGEDARTLNVTLDARTNSAAQAAIIDNKVQFDVANDYDSEKDNDNVKTFDAGWEIVKTTEDGKTPLAGAGFDLAVQIDDSAKQKALLNNLYDATAKSGAKIYDSTVTEEAAAWLNMFTEAAKSSQFEGYTYNGVAVNDLTPEQLQQAAYQTVAAGDEDTKTNLRATLISMTQNSDYDVNGQNTLFFMHKDPNTGEPMAEMDSNESASDDPMGDIIWTPVQAWATTHFSGTDGYLQYCGLAAGTYALIETKAPEGYSMISDSVKLGETADGGGMTLNHAQKFELGVNQDGTLNTGTINGEADYEDSANPDMIVKNYQKSIFPLVGGLGTLFAVIAGLLAMGLALLKRKNDMKNEA